MGSTLKEAGKRPELSLVIPCYNEEEGIERLLTRIAELVELEPRIEVIIVDNGSTDGTRQALKRAMFLSSLVKIVSVKSNIGYGNGIKRGLREASGKLAAWTHADMQTDPMDVLQGLSSAESTGSKFFAKGLRKNRPFQERFFTAGMSVFETLLFMTPMRDINAQPTMFSESLIPRLLEGPDDFGLDLFALIHAKKIGCEIHRFPVSFLSREYGYSKWNTSLASRAKFIFRTIRYSVGLAFGGRRR